MAKSPEEMAQAMIDNLKEKTGKSLEEWMKITTPKASEKHGALVKFLKTEFGIGHGFANLIAHKTREEGAGQPAAEIDLVAEQYAGAKADLKPIYDALIEKIQAFGKDVELAPKKAYVSLRRNKQFGLIQPSTKTRLDVGINLKDTSPDSRLEASGSFNAMVSHRVRLASIAEVDAQLLGWLHQAYEES